MTVLGAGVLGSQIAFQIATHGIPGTIYDIDRDAVTAGQQRLDEIVEQYVADVGEEHRVTATHAVAGIAFMAGLAGAVAQAELVIEAVPERIETKREVYQQLAAVSPEEAVFVTNSSTLLPSAIADATGRPAQFLALHFANHIWRHNIAEVMGTEQTDPAVYERVAAFAEEIGMVPVRLRKEQPGYILNSLLMPLLGAASQLVGRGVADPETVDTTWRIGTGAPLGPFQIFDIVGLRTAHAIANASPGKGAQVWAAYLQSEYLDKGKYGVESGEGFYRYH